MKQNAKIWLILAIVIITLGVMLFAVSLFIYEGDVFMLLSPKYETNIHEIDQDFSKLSLDTGEADVIFLVSQDGKCRVECFEQEKEKHTVTVADDTLKIQVVSTKKLLDYITVFNPVPKLTVYLPKTEYAALLIEASTADVEVPKGFHFRQADISLSTGDVTFLSNADNLEIKITTGDICVEDISSDHLELKVTTGNCNLTDVACKNLSTEGTTGDVKFTNVIAQETVYIHRSTGDVRLEGCDGKELTIQTSTGSVKGSLRSPKVFATQVTTGKVDVPQTTTGGICKITTTTGNIKITVDESE